jgi:NAD(P)-dependent dehydrogenase (short-subunit alcohol dehydrogenase family)
MNRLNNKTAIVTGGASGIGYGISLMYAQEGCRVLIADIDPNGRKAADEIASTTGVQVDFVQSDVSLPTDVARIFNTFTERFSKLDILVNNAGKELTRSLFDTEEEQWDDIIRVNLKSVYLMSRASLPLFYGQGQGTIINMGSITAKNGFANYPAYTATKGAIHALTRQMAMELASKRIRVNTIYPGTIKTQLAIRNFIQSGGDLEKALADSAAQHLVGRLGEPEDVAYCAVYLGSDEASFVTGQEYGVDGGFYARGS